MPRTNHGVAQTAFPDFIVLPSESHNPWNSLNNIRVVIFSIWKGLIGDVRGFRNDF